MLLLIVNEFIAKPSAEVSLCNFVAYNPGVPVTWFFVDFIGSLTTTSIASPNHFITSGVPNPSASYGLYIVEPEKNNPPSLVPLSMLDKITGEVLPNLSDNTNPTW